MAVDALLQTDWTLVFVFTSTLALPPMDYLTLCCIAKDENAFIGEWVAYHARLGVERFIIYDNDSRRPLAETLAPLTGAVRIEVETMPGPARQLPAYVHCLHNRGPKTKWLGFIDVDEYVLPRNDDDLRELLTDYEDHAALGINWVMFGSSGHETPPPGLQIEHYIHRADFSLPTNLHIKSIVQPRHTRSPLSPHHFAFAPDRYCVNEQGFPLPGPYGPHHNERIQLNHYFFRSRRDFQDKIQRGRGDMSTDVFRHAAKDFEDQLRYCVIEDKEITRHAPGVRALLEAAGNNTATSPLPSVSDLDQERNRVLLLLERGRIDLAEALSKRLVVSHNDASAAWSLRALVLAQGQRREEALAAIGRSLRLEQTVENLYQLYRVHTLTNVPDEARRTARYLWWRLHGVDADLQENCAWILDDIKKALA